jgi:hypothetical protein
MKRKSIIWLIVVVIAGLCSASLYGAAEADAQAVEIINKYLAAMGGREALSQVYDYTISGTARVSVMGQGVNGKFAFTVKAPSRWRETLTSEDFVADSGCDGTHLWAVGNGQVRKISELQQQIELEWAGLKLLTGPPRQGWAATFQGQQSVSGKETLVVELTAPSGRHAQYFFDAKTYLLARSVVPTYNPMSRKETECTTDFEKYRPSGQLMLPYWIFTSNGFISKEIEVSEWKFNTAPSDSMFVLPQSGGVG